MGDRQAPPVEPARSRHRFSARILEAASLARRRSLTASPRSITLDLAHRNIARPLGAPEIRNACAREPTGMDVLFAFTGDKFAVVVSDTTSVQQIIVQKDDMEKIMDLDSHKLLACPAPRGTACTLASTCRRT